MSDGLGLSGKRPASTRVDGAPEAGHADYGIDAARTVAWLGLASFGAAMVMLFAAIANAPSWLSLGAFAVCVPLAMVALVFTWSSRVGKLRERVRLVDWLELRTDGRVLDAGSGTGAVLIEAARRTPNGLAVGVDRWRAGRGATADADRATTNARVEGVANQVELASARLTSLPFASGAFDAVSCYGAMRSLRGAGARLDAVREMVRVLTPGGRLALLDRSKTRQLLVAMRSADLVDVRRSRRVRRLVPPARYVTGVKPTR